MKLSGRFGLALAVGYGMLVCGLLPACSSGGSEGERPGGSSAVAGAAASSNTSAPANSAAATSSTVSGSGNGGSTSTESPAASGGEVSAGTTAGGAAPSSAGQPDASGGTANAGGSTTQSGGTDTGGADTSTGGAQPSAGTSSGGTAPAGGTPATGGVDTSGGMSGEAGSPATGGSTPAAGASNSGDAPYMPAFIIGADISGAQQAEDRGTTYKDVDGSAPSGTTSTGGGILTVLKNHGFNYIRLRTWVNPSGGYCDLEHTIPFAAGVKQAGMGLLLDFHYSDTWADPGSQAKPAAWANLSFSDLVAQVRSYTSDVISQLKAANGRPDMVQIGNEIPQGLLFDASGSVGGTGGKVSGSAFENLGALLQAGVDGVKDVDSNILIVMHLDRCNDLAVNQWWLDGVLGQGVPFDILGESCYDRANYQQPASDWAPMFSTLAASYPDLKFMAAEYSDSKQLVNDTIYDIPDQRGLGAFIWEPTGWGEAIFDGSGRAISQYMSVYDNIAATYGQR